MPKFILQYHTTLTREGNRTAKGEYVGHTFEAASLTSAKKYATRFIRYAPHTVKAPHEGWGEVQAYGSINPENSEWIVFCRTKRIEVKDVKKQTFYSIRWKGSKYA